MGNRCPNCNKFVGLEIRDPEYDGPDESSGTVEMTVTVTLECSECGEDMKSTSFEFSEEVPEEVQDHLELGEGHDLIVDISQEPDVTDFYRPRKAPKPRKDGKTVRVPMRYQTHYYAVDAKISLSCSCGKSFEDLEFSDNVPASYFDDLN